MATQAPPAYGSTSAKDSSKDPLVSTQEAFDESDVEDDFKIGVTVSQSSSEIRMGFVRKVYVLMLSATTVIGTLMRTDAVHVWMQSNTWFMWTSIIGSFVALFGCMWKRHSHPANLLFLSMFTVFEAVTVGTITSYYDAAIVLKAFVLATFVFLGLTVFTFQSRYDFSSLGPWLMTGLFTMLGVGLVGLFVPWSNTIDIVYSSAGVLIFSGYILYDTHMILHRHSPDEWVLATISLFLDLINVFLYILRLLNDTSRD